MLSTYHPLYNTYSMIEQVQSDFKRKNPLLTPIFEPTTFCSCQAIIAIISLQEV